MDRVDLRQLTYLLAVAETGSFRSAARRLGVAQPTLSVQLARLERSLGVMLLSRSNSGTSLTAVGSGLIPHVREAIAAVDRIHEECSPATRRTIRIVTPSPMTLLIANIRRSVPQHDVEHHLLQPQAGFAALGEGTADVAVGYLPGDPAQDPALPAVPLAHDRVGVLVPADHPLARRTAVSLRQLRDERWIVPPAGSIFRPFAEDVLTRATVPLISTWTVGDPLAAVQAVRSGVAVSLCPSLPRDPGLPGCRLLVLADVVRLPLVLSWNPSSITPDESASVLDAARRWAAGRDPGGRTG